MYLHFRFILVWHKEIGAKAAPRMLVKLTANIDRCGQFHQHFMINIFVQMRFAQLILYFKFVFVIFCRKEIGKKADHKMWLKLLL